MSDTNVSALLRRLCSGLPLHPLPPPQSRPLDPAVPHAPRRPHHLNQEERSLAIANALRYFPKHLHTTLAKEFAEELTQDGHIYMRRFRPSYINMKAYHIDMYPAKCKQAAAIMLMIMNNLDNRVAQYPHELVTYGGNGCVFSNWAQFLLVMHYLSLMTESQTLVMYSGHPMGLFPSHREAPRVVVTNGMMIPNYSSKDQFNRLFALGVTMYGQMTAGSYCYIGPQGIVHGTTLTILNAARKYLKTGELRGKVYISSGLGGMSGAQGKASVISGCIGVIAEVDRNALLKRFNQGWIQKIASNVTECVSLIKLARKQKEPLSIGFHGNVVSLWEHLAKQDELLVELGSDQTSLHNPFGGGYIPVQLTLEESNELMNRDPKKFKQLVEESLRRHVSAVNSLAKKGMYFWDYGNCFLLEASRAGAEVGSLDGSNSVIYNSFRYPSYVQHIMGDIFSLGFGPFRWICTSGKHTDLQISDQISLQVMKRLMHQNSSAVVKDQYMDNIRWIEEAEKNQLVVGSEARILYADAEGRVEIAVALNTAIKEGKISAPIVLSRDHHDVSGTDSPFRETSNIYDGSSLCADMAIQNVIGDSFRGATWVSIHNGGGVGWGEVMNGGFGLVLDGSQEAERRARMMLSWDVCNGLSRRAWSGHPYAQMTMKHLSQKDPQIHLTLPSEVDKNLLSKL